MPGIRLSGLPNGQAIPLTLEEAQLLHEYMPPNPLKSELKPLLQADGDNERHVGSDDYLTLLNAVNAIRAEGEPRGEWVRELGALLHGHHALGRQNARL